MSDRRAVADPHDATSHRAGLAWLLQRSAVMLPIPGPSSVAQREENVAASATQLAAGEMKRFSGWQRVTLLRRPAGRKRARWKRARDPRASQAGR